MTTKANTPHSTMDVHIPDGVEYVYRDMFNIFAGPEEVIIELGNRNRRADSQAVISDRIVLSVSNAMRLRNAITETLDSLEEVLRSKTSELMKNQAADTQQAKK